MSETKCDWGEMVERTLNEGREDKSSKYKKIDKNDPRYEKFMHCSHVMIYARSNSVVFDMFEKKGIMLMQMRSDGYIGFPGGIVDKGETPVQALCRELKEELAWSEEVGPITEEDYQFTHVDEDKESVFHFFVKEVSEDKIAQIESNMLKAPDYGIEVMGHFRVPLYILGDAFRGFPSFLRNHFIGNSKLQLVETVVNLKFLSEEQMIQALYSAPLITY